MDSLDREQPKLQCPILISTEIPGQEIRFAYDEAVDEEFDEEQIPIVCLCRSWETAKYGAWPTQRIWTTSSNPAINEPNIWAKM
jgi:hypothetical protein